MLQTLQKVLKEKQKGLNAWAQFVYILCLSLCVYKGNPRVLWFLLPQVTSVCHGFFRASLLLLHAHNLQLLFFFYHLGLTFTQLTWTGEGQRTLGVHIAHMCQFCPESLVIRFQSEGFPSPTTGLLQYFSLHFQEDTGSRHGRGLLFSIAKYWLKFSFSYDINTDSEVAC